MTTVTVNALDDMAPSPRATITVSSPDPAAATLSINQLSSEGQILVRSAIGIAAAGGTFSTDYEIPLGEDVSYRVEQFTAAGASLGLLPPVTAHIDLDPGWAIVQDYLVPGDAVKLPAEVQFGSTIAKSRSSQLYMAGFDTIALVGEQSLLQGVPIRLITRTQDEYDKLDAILSGGTALIRTNGMGIGRLFYASIATLTAVPHNLRAGGSAFLWDLIADEVSRNLLEVMVPTVTWQQVIDAYPTWADLIAAHSTWLDLIQNPPPAP